MPLIAASDKLKQLMDANVHRIKSEYLTYKLFTDSAIRDKLRRMGIDAGVDEIIPHLEKLEASKSRHLDKQSVRHTKTRHKQRVARARNKLTQL